MNDNSKNASSPKVKVIGTRHAGEKILDLHLVVPFFEVGPMDDDSGSPKVTLKVTTTRINPAMGDEQYNLTK
jgi:hypothetical protein